jgi:TolB protein
MKLAQPARSLSFHLPVTAPLIFGLLVLTLSTPLSVSAQVNPINIGEVRGGEKLLYQVAIPSFSAMPGSVSLLKKEALPDVIYKDLEISGIFARVKGQNFIDERSQIDEREGKIEFTEWRRLKADFLVQASYKLTDSEISAQVMLWDVGTGIRIFGKEYTKFTPTQWRILAHRVSDDIHFYRMNEKGVANTRILYVHGDQDKRNQVKEVFVMDADGANIKQITQDKSLAVTPCWGAKGTEAFYTSYKDYNPDLCVVSLDGSGDGDFISRWPTFNLSPTWSEATQRIALTLSKDGNSEIYTMDRSGQQMKRLTQTRAIDSSPHWFPNGRQMLFTSDRAGMPQIYMMDADGINQRRLTFRGSYNDSAVISPKGDKIALASRVANIFDLWLIDLDGRNWVPLTGVDGPQGNNEDPSWAPNGRQIAFMSDRTGSKQIWIMNSDGSNQRQLTLEGANQSPAWSPLYEQN